MCVCGPKARDHGARESGVKPILPYCITFGEFFGNLVGFFGFFGFFSSQPSPERQRQTGSVAIVSKTDIANIILIMSTCCGLSEV